MKLFSNVECKQSPFQWSLMKIDLPNWDDNFCVPDKYPLQCSDCKKLNVNVSYFVLVACSVKTIYFKSVVECKTTLNYEELVAWLLQFESNFSNFLNVLANAVNMELPITFFLIYF